MTAGLRLLIFVLAATTAVVGVVGGGAALLRRDRPDLAARLNPWDSQAAELAADRLLQPGASPQAVRSAGEYSRQALAASALSPRALRVMAFIADMNGQPNPAAKLMAVSERLSRRDLPAQMWLIESNVARNDVAGALTHFDRALRSSPLAADILLPVLARAADDPELQGPIADVLASNPKWRFDFLLRTIRDLGTAKAIAGLSRQLDRRSAGFAPSIRQEAMLRLAGMQDYDAAAQVLGQTSAPLPNATFGSQENMAPFTWQVSNNGTFGAQTEQAVIGDRSGLRLFVEAGSGGGEVARHLLRLPPGAYALTVVANGDGEGAAATITLRCADSTRSVTAINILGTGKETRFSGRFAVDSACRSQWLFVSADKAGPVSATSLALTDLRIRRIAA